MADCTSCEFAATPGGIDCPRCGALRSLAIGLGLAVVMVSLPSLRSVLGYMSVLVHEFGHAAVGWLFGYPSIPAFDFRYGGGVTTHDSRKIALVFMVLAAFIWAIWNFRERKNLQLSIGAAAVLWALLVFTPAHRALITFMGHGSELVFAGIFLYRALSGYAIKVPAERPLYAMVGFFIVFDDLRFAWGLLRDPAKRAAYEGAKGGGHWMDFSVLADRYLQVDLAVIAGFFLICCLLTPLCVWLFHRARDPFAMDDVRGL